MRVEVCPVCGTGPNIAGTKYCYGPFGRKHPKARWEFREVVLVDDLRALLAGMELHDDLPDSHDIGYMAAWREVQEWVDAAIAKDRPA